jgi:hypothetical protein
MRRLDALLARIEATPGIRATETADAIIIEPLTSWGMVEGDRRTFRTMVRRARARRYVRVSLCGGGFSDDF